ncbi:hypothetical protein OPT61_g4313 [Boeremia exigua]|uniref:Uncharacterized protein n=1 Tax=Boeremia exigua TaxID=749465 RepID=A0ACC2IEI2_9PLEO|nr:hypothetical protein OPT61_g4313 [Boeremia exigua]
MASNPGTFLRRQRHSIMRRTTAAQQNDHESKPPSVEPNESDDSLEVDLAKAALATGTTAFESQQWVEAESLLQEALRILESLPRHRRAFCDILDLHYKMAMCTYYTQDYAVAEEALKSLRQHEVESVAQQERMCEATHLLSQLYIRMGQINLAKEECEKTLQTRRRLLGKLSDACFESMALMAHIYVLLDNRALAKTYLAMISEERREAVLMELGKSLHMTMSHLDFSSMMSAQPSELKIQETEKTYSENSASSSTVPPAYQSHQGYTSTAAPSPAPSHSSVATSTNSPNFWNSPPRHAPVVPSPYSQPNSPLSPLRVLESAKIREHTTVRGHNTTVGTPNSTAKEVQEQAGLQPSAPPKTLSRKEILEKIGCQPRDNIEEAVCRGDDNSLAKLLNKKKGFWRANLREHSRHERVTALHFAALFGEVDLAHRLLAASYNINEVPFGYSTSLTPLHFALGARQVSMVRFLIKNGARPVEPDTWSTLASQPMTRSWLLKTLSDSERVVVADRVIAILDVLLTAGWQINAPYGAAENTVLHQAVAFWTGSYKMDLDLRIAVTQFLCSRGADPMRKNVEGTTAWDLAGKEGHQELLKILTEAGSGPHGRFKEPIELPGNY